MMYYVVIEFPNPEHDMRFGPFATRDEAEDYAYFLEDEYSDYDGWAGVVEEPAEIVPV